MKATHAVAFILVIIGGLNWLLVGINADWNLVNVLLGSWAWLERLVYILVGLSAVYLIFTHKQTCKWCEKDSSMPSSAPQM